MQIRWTCWVFIKHWCNTFQMIPQLEKLTALKRYHLERCCNLQSTMSWRIKSSSCANDRTQHKESTEFFTFYFIKAQKLLRYCTTMTSTVMNGFYFYYLISWCTHWLRCDNIWAFNVSVVLVLWLRFIMLRSLI